MQRWVCTEQGARVRRIPGMEINFTACTQLCIAQFTTVASVGLGKDGKALQSKPMHKYSTLYMVSQHSSQYYTLYCSLCDLHKCALLTPPHFSPHICACSPLGSIEYWVLSNGYSHTPLNILTTPWRKENCHNSFRRGNAEDLANFHKGGQKVQKKLIQKNIFFKIIIIGIKTKQKKFGRSGSL